MFYHSVHLHSFTGIKHNIMVHVGQKILVKINFKCIHLFFSFSFFCLIWQFISET